MGERYDHRQTNIRGNHVAIVRKGRAGPDVKLLLDSEDAILVEDDDDGNRVDAKATDALSEKIKKLMDEGRSKDQATAIAHSMLSRKDNVDRGGNEIGRTRSGKVVYNGHDDPGNENFSRDDHNDARSAHADRSEHHADAARIERRTAEIVPADEREEAVERTQYHAGKVSHHNGEALKHWASAQALREDSSDRVVLMRRDAANKV